MSTELRVRLPESLMQADLIAGVSYGLFNLAAGERPTVIEQGERKQKRVKITDKGKECFDLIRPRFNSDNDVIIAALSWLNEKPAWVRNARI